MPQHRYYLKDGREVAGASTLSKIGDDQTGLRNASIEMALNHRLDSRIEWTKDTNIGTAVHSMIQQHLMGNPIEPLVEGVTLTDEFQSRTAWLCFRGWQQWYASSGFTAVETEVSLVSEAERFGGTFDAVLEKEKLLYVADWKTSKQFNHAMLTQVAGYALLWNENYPACQITGGGLIVRLSKTSGRAIPRPYPLTALAVGARHILKQRDLRESQRELAIAFKEYGDDEQ